jgi:trehalose 6-phosphate synthase
MTSPEPDPTGHQTIVASNRGPVSFVRRNGDLVASRGAGGLVSALTGALQRSGGLWIASAMTDGDREQAAAGRVDLGADGAGFSVRYLAFDPDAYDAYYNGVSNHVLWFLHHHLWNVDDPPAFDRAFEEAWTAYRDVNDTFAAALHEEGQERDSPAYLVQDYHLSLTPELLRRRDPDAAIVSFSHIPFAGPAYLRLLPPAVVRELLAGHLGADLVGFNADLWAARFLQACGAFDGVHVDMEERVVRWNDRTTHVGVYPISIDVEPLRRTAESPEGEEARRWIEDRRGDAALIVRVDRAELSKNILRGFEGYEELLARRPEWRGRVTFLALLLPSREEIPEYRDYMDRCTATVERINDRFGRPGWQPVEMVTSDDFPLSVAGYQLYDVLVVNPVLDGMNLVAKEGPVMNERDGVLVLSENAGAFAELGAFAVPVNPFDVEGTADALASALDMSRDERAKRAGGLRAAIERNRLDRWVPTQLADLERIRGGATGSR